MEPSTGVSQVGEVLSLSYLSFTSLATMREVYLVEEDSTI